MRWRASPVVLLLIAACGAGLGAHAGLRYSNPLEGSTLGDAPTTIALTFTEPPEPSLSSVQVIDTSGARQDFGLPARVPGDANSLSVAVRRLGPGVYTVNWRVVSTVDGHPSTGTFVFGVKTPPTGGPAAAAAPVAVSRREIAGRCIFLAGLIVLLGAACAEIARFGGATNLRLAIAGWAVAAVGLAVLGAAQLSASRATLSGLLATPVGSALVWRAAALLVAGVAIAIARLIGASAAARREVMFAAVLAVWGAIGVHVAAGHAGAAQPRLLAVVSQWAHVAASGMWIGGLAALLLGFGGATASDETTRRIHRFTVVAAAGLAIVVATGIVRAVNEITSWGELFRTAYGRTVLLKGGCAGVIALLGAFNRWRSVPRASVTLRPLRAAGAAELAIATIVLGAAALLATLPPPASARTVPGLTASGADFATTLRVELSAVSDRAGPNRFTARILDYDTKAAIDNARVTLRFVPIDDPRVTATTLPLTRQADGSFTGAGANLTFDGRWRITVQIEQAATSVDVPVEVAVKSSRQP